MRAEIEPTWGIALRLWWAWLWRTVALAFIIGLAVGIPIGIVGSVLSLPIGLVEAAGKLAGLPAGLVAGIWMFKKHVLGYRGRRFRVAVLENE